MQQSDYKCTEVEVIKRDLLGVSGRKEADLIVKSLFFLYKLSPLEILSIELLKFL